MNNNLDCVQTLKALYKNIHSIPLIGTSIQDQSTLHLTCGRIHQKLKFLMNTAAAEFL